MVVVLGHQAVGLSLKKLREAALPAEKLQQLLSACGTLLRSTAQVCGVRGMDAALAALDELVELAASRPDLAPAAAAPACASDAADGADAPPAADGGGGAAGRGEGRRRAAPSEEERLADRRECDIWTKEKIVTGHAI